LENLEECQSNPHSRIHFRYNETYIFQLLVFITNFFSEKN